MPTITQAEARSMGIPRKTLQTILLDKHYFTLRTAKKWLKDHNYVNSYYRTTKNEYSFMQTFPIEGSHYWSFKVSPVVLLVYQEF